jgi:hypothetical protein
VLARLEKIASEVTGRPIRVVCRLEESEGEAGSDAGTPPQPSAKSAVWSPEAKPRISTPANGRADAANVKDAYVEQAREIFGATIESVNVANRPAGGVPEESDPLREN